MTIAINFDQIAGAYDHQRAHPPEVSAAIGAALATTIGAPSHILELGVGTGRIAIPAARAGLQVVGIDLSREMLRVAQQSHMLRLACANIGQLPFADGSFDAALAVHVLHLLPDWRAGLNEIVRVIRPQGLLVQGQDWRDPESCVGRTRATLRQIIMELAPGARPPGAGAAVTQHLARLGGVSTPPQVAAEWESSASPAALIASMAARADSETWALPEELLGAAIERLMAWANEEYADPTAPQPVTHRFLLTVTRFEQAKEL